MKKYNIPGYINDKEDLKQSLARIPERGTDYHLYTRNELIIKFCPLAENIARKFSTSQQASGVMSIRDLIQEGSSLRRKFIDSIISQNNNIYLNNIINYHKVLTQRNALLKYFNKSNSFDLDNISIYNDQLSQLSKPIYETRKKFFKNFFEGSNHTKDFIKEFNIVFDGTG